MLLPGKVDELLESEEQQVVGGYHQHVVVYVAALHGQQQVADGAQAGVVGLCAVVDDGDGLLVVLLLLPCLEDGGELVVSDDDVLVDVADGVDVVEHAPQDGVVAYLQQGLGMVAGQLTQSGGIACGNDDVLHILFLSPLQIVPRRRASPRTLGRSSRIRETVSGISP